MTASRRRRSLRNSRASSIRRPTTSGRWTSREASLWAIDRCVTRLLWSTITPVYALCLQACSTNERSETVQQHLERTYFGLQHAMAGSHEKAAHHAYSDKVIPLVSKRSIIAERIGERQDFGGHAAPSNGRSPGFESPFCALSVTVDLDDGGIDHGVFHVGIVGHTSNSRFQISAFAQSRKRVRTLFQWPNEGGRSRQGLPVRAIHSTASTNSRLLCRCGQDRPACQDKAAPSSLTGRQSKRNGPSIA